MDSKAEVGNEPTNMTRKLIAEYEDRSEFSVKRHGELNEARKKAKAEAFPRIRRLELFVFWLKVSAFISVPTYLYFTYFS